MWHPDCDAAFKSWVYDEYSRWRGDWEASYGRQPGDYSLLFDYTYPDADARQGFIERLCSGCEPGPGYIYLASLTLAGYFQTFLTTNFDDLINDALFRYAGINPMVCAFDSQVSSIRLQSPRPKIIKLHGDYLFNNLRNVGSEVARLDRNMEDKFGRTCESYGLIVMGYSGEDQSVMAPLRAMLHSRDRLRHGLHWCVYSPPSENRESVEIPEDLYRMWEQYPDKVHLYDTGTFDTVMEDFYFGCRCAPPQELAQPEERALYARLRDGIENADQTWQLTSRFSNLLGRFREAAMNPPSEVLKLLDEADQEHLKGQEKCKAKDFSGARPHFETAISKSTEALSKAKANEKQKVRAFRRRSGAGSGISEIILRQSGHESAATLNAARSQEFRDFATKARDDAREGLEFDSKIASLPELRGHRLNLWFNGLISYAYLLDSASPIPTAELIEALAWLENMTGDELRGEEYVGYLEKEIGGPALLVALRNFDREPTPKETKPSESAGLQ
jgi:hypothetical protein